VAAATKRPGPWAGGRFDIEGHRGARGLAPENTLAGIRAAAAAGVTAIEIDVRLTADGQLVLWHDAVLAPGLCRPTGADLTGARVDELTLAQLRTVAIGGVRHPRFPTQQLSPGASFATLHEVLDLGEALAPGVWWTIELKVDPVHPVSRATRLPLLDGVIAEVHEHGIAQRCFIHSFDWGVLDLSRELEPALLRSALVEVGKTYAAGSEWLGSVRWEDHGDDLAGAAAAIGACAVGPEYVDVDAALVERAHQLGIAVLPWTVNEPDDLLRMHALGVDGLVTDYPDRAAALLWSR
jgi:glycerophosphoryl diester phosphodiesterase